MKKIIGIFIVTLLIGTAVFPVAGNIHVDQKERTQGNKWIIFMFVRGKVENISEELINNAPYYNCTAIDVKYFWLFFSYPNYFWLEFERRPVWHQDGFLISKQIFHGVINEGRIFGIVFNSGKF